MLIFDIYIETSTVHIAFVHQVSKCRHFQCCINGKVVENPLWNIMFSTVTDIVCSRVPQFPFFACFIHFAKVFLMRSMSVKNNSVQVKKKKITNKQIRKPSWRNINTTKKLNETSVSTITRDVPICAVNTPNTWIKANIYAKFILTHLLTHTHQNGTQHLCTCALTE